MRQMFDMMYVQGYLAALMDVQKTFASIQDDLKIHKRKQCAKTYQEIINFMISHRTVLREVPGAFVRCNDTGYEIYVEGCGVYDPQKGRVKEE